MASNLEKCNIQGPALSDADFFNKVVDTSIAGLSGIKEKTANHDFKAARKIFADYIRKNLEPERYFTTPFIPSDNAIMYPGETMEQAAERILNLEIIATGTPHKFEKKVDWFANPTFNKYKEWTWQLSRHHEFKILGLRYRETGDERFAKCFVELFESWVHQAVVPEDAAGNETLCWRTIEAGIRMGHTWPYALHAFYKSPYFTDDVLVDWYKSLWEHGWRLRNFHRTGNWLIMEMNGLVHIGILHPEFKDATDWKEYAFAKLTEELALQLYPDGFQYELTTNYHQVLIANYLSAYNTGKAYAQHIPEEFKERLEKAYEMYTKLVMPDGRLPDLNDGKWAKVSDFMTSAVEIFPERNDFKWLLSEGLTGNPPDFTSILLPYAGMAVMRDGWEKDSVWAFFDAGPFGRAHQHEDKLSLLIHAYGQMLLTEGGIYAYDNSEMRKYILSTRAHNTIRVNGYDQNRSFGYHWENEDINKISDIKWSSSAALDVTEGIYDEGYGPEASLRVKHVRKVMFIKAGFEGLLPCFIVIDRLYPESSDVNTYEILWNLTDRPAEKTGTTVISGEFGKPGLTIIPSSTDELSLEIVIGQEQPEWQGWKPFDQGLQGQFSPVPTAVYKLKSTESAKVVTLLYPSKDTTCPVTQIADEGSFIKITLQDGNEIRIDEPS